MLRDIWISIFLLPLFGTYTSRSSLKASLEVQHNHVPFFIHLLKLSAEFSNTKKETPHPSFIVCEGFYDCFYINAFAKQTI